MLPTLASSALVAPALPLLYAAVGSVAAASTLRPLSLRAAVYRNQPHAYQDANGNWTGLVFDVRDLLVEKALEDGFELQIDVDTVDGILSDWGTPDGTLSVLAPDCGADGAAEDSCYDIILGAYTRLPRRATMATFTPPYLTTFMTTVKLQNGKYDSIAEANADGGSVCLWEGSSVYAALEQYVEIIVACPSQDACYATLKEGGCDLMGEEDVTAHNRAANDPKLIVGEAVPDTLDPLALPMKMTLDAATQILVTKWMHEANAEGELTGIQSLVEYFAGPSTDDGNGNAENDTAVPGSGSPGDVNVPTPAPDRESEGPSSFAATVGISVIAGTVGVIVAGLNVI